MRSRHGLAQLSLQEEDYKNHSWGAKAGGGGGGGGYGTGANAGLSSPRVLQDHLLFREH